MVNLTTAPKQKAAPKDRAAAPENRVWEFFEDGVKRTWKIDPQVVAAALRACQ
jgi:hypothetical protein